MEVPEKPASALRILVLFGNIPLLGKERANIQVLSVLKEQGAEVLFATHKAWGHESIQPMLDSVGLDWKPMSAARPLRRTMGATDLVRMVRDLVVGWWELARMIRAFRPTHLHVPNEYQSLYNLPILLLARCPIVYRLGDDPGQVPGLLRAIWEKAFVPRVDAWVCISQFIRDRIVDAGAELQKTHLIYNYPPERPPLPVVESTEIEPFEGRTVLYMGQLTRDKGVDLLVEVALNLCRTRGDVRFLIAGDYTWQNPFAEALIERAAEAGLSDRIRFLGYVKDMPGLLAAADIHVCPSVWEEPLSNVVPEAKLAGVPSVVFPSGGLPELIVSGKDGWICDAKTAESLQDALERMLMLSATDLAAMGEAAQESMERLGITERAFTDAWMRVYRQASTGNHR